MTIFSFNGLGCIALLVIVLVSGCQRPPADQPELGIVTGTITLEGQPLNGANVLFQPASGRPSIAATDEKGHYSLSYKLRVPGAKIGQHQVQVTTYRPNRDPQDASSPEVPESLPARYNSQSELTADVKPGQNEISFDLKKK